MTVRCPIFIADVPSSVQEGFAQKGDRPLPHCDLKAGLHIR